MQKGFKRIFKWFLRILLGIVGLLVLLILLFYLFRGKITEKALAYVNEMQPGEVVFEKLSLRPFLDFPNVSLRVREVQFLAPGEPQAGSEPLPVLDFNNIYVSMDVVQLIRGTYMISEVRLSEGVINYTVGADSVSNVEKALGILFGGEQVDEPLEQAASPIMLDLERLEIRDMVVNYEDQPAGTAFTIHVNGLESAFSYDPDLVTAAVMLHSEIPLARTRTLTLDKPRSVSFSSAVHFDQVRQQITLDQSMLDIQDAVFKLEGAMDLGARTLDIDFSAINSGIDLLNFLLSGVLNLDAIEQIGDGSIRLEGNASGSYDTQLPLIQMNVVAADMGFRVHSIDQSVTGIAFEGAFTNGARKDLSEAAVHLEDFHVDFPKGSLDAEIHVSNLLAPYAEIRLEGDADLSLINEIIRTETVRDMHGNLRIEGDVRGSVDKNSGTLLDSAGLLKIYMDDLGFTLPGYQVQHLDGAIQVQGKVLGVQELAMVVNNNKLHLEGEVHNLLPWLLDFDTDPSVRLAFRADDLLPGQLLNDSSLKGPVRDLGFRLAVSTGAQELRSALENKRIPGLLLVLEDLSGTLPGYASVSEGRMTVQLAPDTATIRGLHARIGESAFSLDASLINYERFIGKDSSAILLLDFDLAADRLLASDLLTFDNRFSLLPPQFATEEIRELKFKGKVQTTVSELLKDSILPDFRFISDQMHWRLKEYPDAFHNLVLDIERVDSLLVLRHFSGSIGESDFNIRASVMHLLDTSRTISGEVQVSSVLLDLDRLLAYSLLAAPGEVAAMTGLAVGGVPESGLVGGEVADREDVGGDVVAPDTILSVPPDLSIIDFPDLALELEVKELRVGGNILKNLDGRLATKPYKMIYFDQFSVQSETGGSMLVDGQFNVSDPGMYMLSANFEIDTVNMSDFELPIAIGDSVYSLEDNFNGVLSADGLAEFFINPDFSINTDYSTAMFNVRLENGRVKHFSPLRALARYTGNKDLDNVQFGLLRNSFTLMNGAVQVPLMSIESTLGLILLEGEQHLDGNFLYLARVPVTLVRGTAWNMLTNQQNKQAEEGEVQQMRAQKFLLVTISVKDGAEEVKIGDKRDQFR
ncbi:MAG: hypothetical protein P1P82_08140 [Bacteroidales bacterium]|nr:hypothetical protein [Bacteroidales bacterium]